MIRRFALASAILIAAASATPAMASTATENLDISATVPESCAITAEPIAFGNYDPIVTHATEPLTTTGTLTVQCTMGTSATILLGQGANASTYSTNSSPDRRLAGDGGGSLDYNISKDGAGNNTWGNTTGTGHSITGTGNSQDISVSLSIPPAAAQSNTVVVGTYTDTVVATVSY
jgi:spore coat protein U-like protein